MKQNNDPVQAILMAALRLREPAGLDEGAAIEDLPNMDSLAHVRMISEIEKTVGGSLSIDEILMLSCVQDIRDLLRSKGKYAG